ncbi:MAG: ABC transporter substrate-binding protein [Porticoccaceae bacterium]|nr:ABC transporter substrate-binding protein [Porticoccaceae bacterium]MDG1475099.1 ABC transporter substrate-binding protein [Porticoccaceae bacterium]
MKYLSLIVGLALSVQNADGCSLAKDSTRIAVGGGSITEILYFLGAEDKIVAVDTTSNYPPEAKSLPSIGYVRNLSAEGILSLRPTLVLGENDIGPSEVVSQIKNVGIDLIVIEEKHSADGIIKKIQCIAKVIDKKSIANQIIDQQLIPTIKRLGIEARKVKAKQTSIMFILSMQGGSPIVAGKNVSADGLISMIGGTNSPGNFNGWKPVSTEAIIAALPEVILISTRGLSGFGSIEELKLHPALKHTPAVKNQKIFVMDGMEMLGFGPRTLDAALSLAKKISF